MEPTTQPRRPRKCREPTGGSELLYGLPQQPAVWTVYTTTDGRILRFNAGAAQLLNTGERWAKGRDLLAFFDENRRELKVAMHLVASTGDTVDVVARLRPRERRPFRVRVRIARPSVVEGDELEWTVAPDQITSRRRKTSGGSAIA